MFNKWNECSENDTTVKIEIPLEKFFIITKKKYKQAIVCLNTDSKSFQANH